MKNKKFKVWYTLEKNNKNWTIWRYKEGKYSYGSLGIYTSDRKVDCLNYAKANGIKIGKRFKK